MSGLPRVGDVLVAANGGVPLAAEDEARARAALEQQRRGRTPWYIRLLIGLGAWLGSWFMLAFALGFLALILEGRVEGASIVMGGGLAVAGVWLHKAGSGELVRQLALVASFTGQMLIIGGVGVLSESIRAGALTALALSGALIVVFADKVHRFVSTVVAAVAVAVLLWEARVPSAADLIAVALVAVALIAWRMGDPRFRHEHAEALDAVAFGAVVTLFGGFLLDAALGLAGVNADGWDGAGLPTVIAVSAGLVWLVYTICAEHDVEPRRAEPLVASLAVVLFAGLTRSTPALVVAVLFIVLGFDRRRPTLVGLAIAFFLGFGALYYYSLDLTLLAKAGVLVGSGLVCLASRALLRWRVSEAA